MSQMNPNNVAASITIDWTEGNVLTVLKNDGFKPPIDLSAVAGFNPGDVCCIPNDVNGDISAERYYLVVSCADRPVYTTGGGSVAAPATCAIKSGHAEIMDASVSAPATAGRRWVLLGGSTQTTTTVPTTAVVPARLRITVELRSYGNL